MEFTFRPDNRYIAKAGGRERVPHRVERGRYLIGRDKLTLAPYPGLGHGLGQARGFEVDYYDGNLFVIGSTRTTCLSSSPTSASARK
jgi:hypothetical protein